MVNARSGFRVGFWAIALVCAVLVPDAGAKGHPKMSAPGGHHSGGFHPPKMHPMPHPTYHAPKMPSHAPNVAHKTPHPTAPKTSTPRNIAHNTVMNNARALSTNVSGAASQSHYYGSHRSYGRGRMPYRGSGYGYGYGRRRYGMNRYSGAIVSRLRSAHAMLARADHDYQGHRVQAMRSVRSAIRQFSHSSSGWYGNSGMNRGFMRTVSNRNNMAGRGRRVGRLSQAQSDALMRRAHQTLQLVGSHMANQGGSSRTARAYAYVNRAMQHIQVGLNVR